MSDWVTCHPLRIIGDDRGAVLHMLRSSDPHFEAFGEIYFSTVLQGAVKAWHRHRTKIVNFAVPSGHLRLVTFDPDGKLEERELGRDTYHLVTIRPGVYYGFQGMARGESLLANCATQPFDPHEGDSLPPDTDQIPYQWPRE